MTLNNALRILVLVGLFAILFVPLIVANSLFFPYITGKAFTFRILAEILFALWLLLALIDSRYRPRRSWLLVALSVFVGVVTLAAIFGENPHKSFWSNYERMEGLISYLHLFAYFLVLISVLRTEKLWQWFFHASLLANVLVALHGLLQLFGKVEISPLSGTRVDATLGNATYVAVYMLTHLFLVGWLMLRNWKISWSRYLYLPVILLQLTILYSTATRGAILGLIGGLFLAALLFMFLARKNPVVWRCAAGVLAAVVVAVGVFWFLRDSAFVQKSPVLSRFAKISLTETTTESRLTIWQMSLRGFKEHPLLGWGSENYLMVFNKYYEPKLWRQEPWFDRSHNIFLDWLISAGILGLLGYFSLFIVLLYYLWRPRFNFSTAEKGLFTGLLAAYFFHNIFVFDNLISYLLLFSFLAYIHHRVTGDEAASAISHPRRWYLAAILLLVLLPVLYLFNLKPLLAARQVILAITPPFGAKNLEHFKKALAYDGFGSAEISEQLVRVALNTRGKTAPPELWREFVGLAAQQMERVVVASPQDARPRLIFGVFLINVGAVDQGIIKLEEARALAPRKQAVLFELASAYLAKGEKDKALSTAKEAYELDPRFGEARKLYALMTIYDSEFGPLKGVLRPEDYPLDERFINAYADVKQYGEVVKLWEEKVASEPANVQFRFSLAASYLTNGERNKAIAELAEAIKLNPQVKNQAEHLINEIRMGRNPHTD